MPKWFSDLADFSGILSLIDFLIRGIRLLVGLLRFGGHRQTEVSHPSQPNHLERVHYRRDRFVCRPKVQSELLYAVWLLGGLLVALALPGIVIFARSSSGASLEPAATLLAWGVAVLLGGSFAVVFLGRRFIGPGPALERLVRYANRVYCFRACGITLPWGCLPEDLAHRLLSACDCLDATPERFTLISENGWAIDHITIGFAGDAPGAFVSYAYSERETANFANAILDHIRESRNLLAAPRAVVGESAILS